MQIQLFKSKAETHRVNKIEFLTPVISLEGTLKEQCSITTPSINIQLNSFIDFNYAYIPEFKRYYYVTDIINVLNDIWRIELSCDVLMSFKNDYLPLTALIERQENIYNPNIIDRNVITDNEPLIEVIESNINQFTSSTDDRREGIYSFVLVCNSTDNIT